MVRVKQDRKAHWEGVYEARQFTDVSWYQELPEKSLALIAEMRELSTRNEQEIRLAVEEGKQRIVQLTTAGKQLGYE